MNIGDVIEFDGMVGLIEGLPAVKNDKYQAVFGNEFRRSHQRIKEKQLVSIDVSDLSKEELINLVGLYKLLVQELIDDKKPF